MSFAEEVFTANGLIAPEVKIDKPELIVGHDWLGTQPRPSDGAEDYESIYGMVATVFRCVNVLTSNIAQLKLKVYDADTDEEIEEPYPEDLVVFRRPNKWQTYYDFWEQTIGYLELSGEVPWLLEVNGVGMVKSMIPLRPDRVKIVPSATDYVSHYLFTIGGEDIRLEADEVLFTKYFNPLDDFRGLSPISAAANDITLDLYSVDANKSTYKRGARPSGVLSTEKQVPEPEMKKLSDRINELYAGKDKFGRIVTISHGFKWQQLGMSNKDLQFIEQRQFSSKEIAKVYGVPPIYIMDFKEASVLANADVQARLLWEATLLPKLIKWEEHLNKNLVPRVTTRHVYIQFDRSVIQALRKNVESLAKVYETATKLGWATPNQAREKVLGLPREDSPALDSYYIDPNLIPIAEAQPKGLDGTDVRLRGLAEATGELRKCVGEVFSDGVSEIEQKVIEAKRRLEEEKEASFLRKARAQFMRLANSRTVKFRSDIAPLFIEQGKEVAKKLRAQKMYKQIDVDAVQFDFQEWVKRFEEKGKPHIASAVEEAMRDLAVQLGREEELNLANPRVGRYVGRRVESYALLVNETSKDKVDDIIRRGIDAGLSVEEMALQIEAYFEGASKFRADRVARTEMVSNLNWGRQESMKQLGITAHRWVTQRDSDVRDSHAAADGQVVQIGEEFTQLGADYGGDRTYPSDFNERCFTIPVIQRRD